ncbi:arginine ABC transporter permease ArtM [Shewanella marina]|uniref:arginine ABC transporter permease ArtM n=1 Tax=Shewanella marina TaxID=487319 RepID=UPI000471CAEC|nr:arginine ABC transporter permease ArtM [Shewanella marina]
MLAGLYGYIADLSEGVLMTLSLTFSSLLVGTIIAVIGTLLLTVKYKSVYWLVKCYLTLFTGTPLLVQIFLIYYGSGQFEWLKESRAWVLLSEPWFCAVLALSLNCGAYTTLLFHGALSSINRGQWESCQSLGMSHSQTLKVLMPYALKRAYPAYSNEVVLLLKGSSLASTITIMDIMGWSQRINAQTYDTLMVFGAAGLLYLLLNLIITVFMRLFEKRLLAFEQV